MTGESVLECIRRRRVTRFFAREKVSRHALIEILLAARWAPSAGNRRLHRFVVVTDPPLLKVVRAVAPGIRGYPPALVVICIDWERAVRLGCQPLDRTLYIDVGTAAQNMLLATEAIGLGAGPVTSFSKAAIGVALRLPESLTPEMIVCLGHRASRPAFPGTRPAVPTRLEDLVIWREPPDSDAHR